MQDILFQLCQKIEKELHDNELRNVLDQTSIIIENQRKSEIICKYLADILMRTDFNNEADLIWYFDIVNNTTELLKFE